VKKPSGKEKVLDLHADTTVPEKSALSTKVMFAGRNYQKSKKSVLTGSEAHQPGAGRAR